MHSGALKGARTQTGTHHQTNRVYLNCPLDAFSSSTAPSDHRGQNCSFGMKPHTLIVHKDSQGSLPLLLHRQKHECIPQIVLPCWASEMSSLNQSSFLDESNSILSLIGTIESLEKAWRVSYCEIQDSNQHCSRTNWLMYSFLHQL